MTNIFILCFLLSTNIPPDNFYGYSISNSYPIAVMKESCFTARIEIAAPKGIWWLEFSDNINFILDTNTHIGPVRISNIFTNDTVTTNYLTIPIPKLRSEELKQSFIRVNHITTNTQ